MKSIKQIMLPLLLMILVSFGISPHLMGQGSQVFSTPGTTSFTLPPGVTTFSIKLWGAGGGGGNTAGTEGQGGGGGGAFQMLNVSRTDLPTYSIVVGAGGTAGNPGANTTAGATFIAAGGSGSNSGNGFGGLGGVGVAQTGFSDVTSAFAWNGGNAGASTNPQQTSFGGGGGGRADNGINGGNGTNGGTSGSGAPGVGGSIGGGAGGNVNAVGGNATSYGGGGGGRGFNGTISGTGGNGRIEFIWNCPTLTSLSYPSPTVCSYSTALAATVLPASAIGGTYTSAGNSLAGFLNASTGAIATGAPQGTHTITYGWPAFGGCPAASVSFTLTIAPQAVATGLSYSGTPFCTNSANGSPSFTTQSGVAGVYSAGAGLSINATTGIINPSASSPGTYTVTYTVAASGNCNAVTTSTSVTITALPTITNFDYPPAGTPNKYCAGAGIQTPTSTVTNPNNNAISYSYTTSPGLTLNTTTGAINPATSTPGTYTVTMSIAAGGGCATVTATSIVEILARPTATIAYIGNPFCQTVASTTQAITISGITGGPLTTVDFTATPAGLTINSTTGAIDLNSTPGVYIVKYRFTGFNGCLDSSVAPVTIKPRPTSTISYAGPNPICSNISPVVSGNVVAVGAWTLTLSNGQTTTGMNSGSWSITVNTLNPGQTTTYSVTSLVDINCSAVAVPDMPGSVTITKRTTTSGSIPTAANVKVCEGLEASINVTLTSSAQCAPAPQFSGVFKIEKWNGASWIFQNNYPWTLTVGPSTTGIAAAVAIPASNFPNATSNTLLYRVSWVSLTDCNGCTADPLTGSVVIESVPTADLTISASPIGDVCPGSNIVFTVNQTTTIPNAVFNWVATDPQGNVLGSNSNVSFGTNAVNTNLSLSCPFNGLVTFTFNSINPNCCNCIGAPIIRTVMVRDIVKPTWTTVANVLNRTVECDDATALAAAQALAPTATDNCDNNLVIVKTTGAFVSNGAPCIQAGTYTNTWTVTDACLNTVAAVYTQVITKVDTKAPVLTGTIPAGQTLINNCKANAPVPPSTTTIAALYTDNCGTVVVTLATTNTGDDCAWSFTHTYTVKDNCGNTVAVSPVIVYSGGDKTAPVLNMEAVFPQGQSEINNCLSNAPAGPSVSTIAGLYIDNCGGPITVVKTTTTTGTDCNWTVVYTYSIKDKCGNEVLPKPSVTYQGFDATAPVLSGTNTFPAGQTGINNCLSNPPVGPTEAAIAAIYSDNCGGTITVVKTSVTTGTDCAWTVTYTYSIKDKCGNEVTPKPTVVYSGGDLTAPTLIAAGTFPASQSGINNCIANAPVGPTVATIAALYSDNCGGAITVVKTGTPTGTNCAWTVTYTYSIKDKCNNEVLPRPTVTYSGGDLTAPTLITAGSFPGGMSEINGCIGSAPIGPTTSTIAALYQDNCGGAITVTKSGTPTGTNCAWSVTYTYTISDACGNIVLPKPTVTYSGSDQTAPVFTNVIPMQTINTGAGVNCSGVMPDYRGLANVTDCGTFTLAQLAPYAPGTMVYGFNGTVNVIIEATDACGNKSQTTFVVELRDFTPPVAICKPYTVILNAAGTGSIVVANVNNGSYDNCTPASSLVYTLSQTNFTCANVGTNSVILSVEDLCHNISTCTATVTVIDNIAPVISCFGDTTINKTATCTYVMPDLTFRVNKADACGIASVTQVPAIGSVFGASVMAMPVTLTVTDNHGNSSSCTFNITFRDVTPPVIAGCPGNITVNTGFGNTACSQTATWIPPTATDACIACCVTQTITGNYAPGATFPVGVTTVTYTATDIAGNTSTCSFTVTVIDNTKPIITGCPANISVNTGVGRTTCDQTATWIEPTATDNCTATANLVRYRSHAPGATFPVGTTTVKYAFRDVAGNTSDTCYFNVTVIDNTVPIFTSCPSNIVNPPINTAGCIATVVTPNPVFTDNCGVVKLTWTLTGVTTGSSPTTGINYVGTKTFNFGVTTVTYTATDVAGNSATCVYTVSVTRPLTASISGTSTVLQNNTTTSTVSFTVKGGTAPYTIVYSTTAGGYPAAGTYTIVTTPANTSTIGGDNNWLVTTVPQSNAVPGTYTYTLVSVTDAFGCVVTPNTTAVITVVNTDYPAPDLTPSFSLGSPIVQPSATKFGYINLTNVSPNPTTGQVYFEVYTPSNFNLIIGQSTTAIGSTNVNNNDFVVTYYPGLGYAITSKPGVIIPAGTNLKIGYNVDAAGSTANYGDMVIILGNGTGGIVTVVGDSNSANNKGSKTYTISN